MNIVDLLQDIWNVICQSWPLLQDILQQAADPDSDLELFKPIVEQLTQLQNLQQKNLESLQPYAQASQNSKQYDAVKFLSDKLSETLPKVKQALDDENRPLLNSYAQFAQEVVNAIDVKSGR